ncbi:MAG: hypothetical protein IJT97_09230 [Bacteroidaceae bacterium]|nr:hypothetical protein [Bacteroidaceae bacterium]
MKKIFVFILSALAFVACGSDNDDNGNSNNNGSGTTLSEAVYAGVSKTLILSQAEFESLPENIKVLFPKSIDFLSSGYAIIELSQFEEGFENIIAYLAGSKAATRADEKAKSHYLKGKYTATSDGKSYNIPGYGTITVSGNKISFKPENVGETIEIDLDKIIKNDAVKSGDNTKWLCRSWRVVETDIEVEGSTTYGALYEGCNLKEIADDIVKHGVNVSQEDREKLNKLGAITDITFSQNGCLSFIYSGDRIDLGTWNWADIANGGFIYEWADKNHMGNAIINAASAGVVKFDNNNCDLSIGAQITNGGSNYIVNVTLTLAAQ